MTSARPDADVALVVAAAGTGSRYSRDRSKLFEPLGDLLLFLHCLRSFAAVIPAERTVLVVGAAEHDRFAEALRGFPGGSTVRLVDGGASRAESVLRGLQALPASAAFAAIHDAARPLASADLLRRCIASARDHGSGVAARRVTDTIKVADTGGVVLSTPDRSRLWAAETPQVFRADDLRRGYMEALCAGRAPTDDAAAIEGLGLPVHLVESFEPNPKITQAGDLALVAALSAPRG